MFVTEVTCNYLGGPGLVRYGIFSQSNIHHSIKYEEGMDIFFFLFFFLVHSLEC